MTITEIHNWHVLIVDDEKDIHDLLKMSLQDLSYNNKNIRFSDAYNSVEAQKILRNHPDIAVIILDVMMESDDAGLSFIKFVRDELGNSNVRILLHTGQPGIAPKKDVIDQYSMDGYIDKNIADSEDCYVAVKVALETYAEKISLKESAKKDDIEMLADIANYYITLLQVIKNEYNYEKELEILTSMSNSYQELLAYYTSQDLHNSLEIGTTKTSRLSQKDYTSLLQIQDIHIIYGHTRENYAQEQSKMHKMIYQAAKDFHDISLLSNTARENLHIHL